MFIAGHLLRALPLAREWIRGCNVRLSSLSLLPCSSLVATNDHLLRELEETKLRHEQEVMQMSLNYEHLRRTVDFIQSTS